MVSCLFQSTLPHGSDFSAAIVCRVASGFQSTLPHGSDKAAYDAFFAEIISIHAPSRERLL